MPVKIRMFVATIALLTAGTALADPAAESSPLGSIMPKGGFFGAFSSKSPTRETAPPASGTPASNTSYWTDVQGGGMFGFAGVEAAERCTTKACNLYYGDAPSDESEQPAPVVSQGSADPTPIAPEPETSSVGHRRSLAQRASSCAPSPQDPWRCFR